MLSHRAGGEHKHHKIKQRMNTINQHNRKLSSACALWRWSPRHGYAFSEGSFYIANANHLASNDNLTRTTKRQNTYQRKLIIHIKISPVGDWRSTSLEWSFSILDRCIVWHSVEHHSPTFAYVATLCRIKLSFYRRHYLPSSKSRDTKTRTNIKNPAWSNLDIVL